MFFFLNFCRANVLDVTILKSESCLVQISMGFNQPTLCIFVLFFYNRNDCVNLRSFCAFLCAVKSLGLKPLGEDTGTADILSRLIIERMMWFCAVFSHFLGE